mgnify:CR=1 FL=1
MEQNLSEDVMRKRGIFAPEFVAWLKKTFYEHNVDLSMQIYQIFLLEIWFQTFIDPPAEAVGARPAGAA